MGWSTRTLDNRIKEVLVDAYGEDEQLGAFACVMDNLLDEPAAATIVGEAVELMSVHDGGQLLGLRATCQRTGRTWEVALVDVELRKPVDAELGVTVAAYRRWVGADR